MSCDRSGAHVSLFLGIYIYISYDGFPSIFASGAMRASWLRIKKKTSFITVRKLCDIFSFKTKPFLTSLFHKQYPHRDTKRKTQIRTLDDEVWAVATRSNHPPPHCYLHGELARFSERGRLPAREVIAWSSSQNERRYNAIKKGGEMENRGKIKGRE